MTLSTLETAKIMLADKQPLEDIARLIGGNNLVKVFDAIQAQQRKRWNAPDWREQPIIDADLINWQDLAEALKLGRFEWQT